ncbi:hypothetical protein BDZ45DRAFT_684805 [Acephala macrosclerotiorum]|nr:hypothetical protein BDZ45DRAFT_684805 [Acephala macrosclerotiorum]
MPYYWDFRTILDVDPETDRTCVGTTAQGLGCRNPINIADRGTAGRLLDQMDRSKSLKSSIDHLETLAELLLCKHRHNNHKSFAYLSQVDEVSARWIIIVEEEYRIVKKKQEKEKALKAKKELQRVAESAKQMKAELEEESLNKVPLKSSRKEPSSRNDKFRITTAGLYDPFVTATSSRNANNIPPKPPKLDREEIAKSTVSAKMTSKPHMPVKVEEVEIGTPDSSPQKSGTDLPTPESTPRDLANNSRQHIKQENTPTPTPMKQRENSSQALTPPSSIKVTRKTTEPGPGLDLQDGSKPKFEGVKAATEQTWSFPVLNDEKEQVGESSSVSSSQKQLLPSPAIKASVPRVPLGEKGTSSHNNMKMRKPKTGYELGNQETTPFKNFNFEINGPRSLLAPESSSKTVPTTAFALAQFFAFDQSGDESTRILDGKGTQGQLETPNISVSHDNSKSELSSISQPNSISEVASFSQVSSMSQLVSVSEAISKTEPITDIKQPSMTQNATDIHLGTDNDSTTDIEATTPSTIIEFPSDVQNTPHTQFPRSNQSQSPSPPPKSNSPHRRSPSPSFGTALIIPPSTPYKTHLPSRFTTEPRTPSHSTQSQSPTVQSPSSYAADLQIWERIERMEKPLPHLPWEPLKGEMRKGIVVRVGEGYKSDGDRGEGRCLGSSRLGRLGRMILGKLRGDGI